MNDDQLRTAMRATAVFNVLGALAFGFPDSVGRLAGLAGPVPGVYRSMVALFILLFGGAYAWLSTQRRIDRPMVAFAAIGKASAFAVIFLCWLFGAISFLGVVTITGDLVFAGLFAWWLLASPAPA